MKRQIITLALLAFTGLAAQAEAVGDTLVIEKPSSVKIETRDTVQRIVINGSKDDDQFHYVQRISIPDSSAVRRTMKSVKDFNKIAIKSKDGKPSKWEASGHIFFGMNLLTSTPDDYDFNPGLELGLSVLGDWRPFGRQNVWSIGLGIELRHYGYTSKKLLDKDANNMLVPYAFADQQDDRKSSIILNELQVPVMYTHYFDKRQKWGLSLGAIVNWNMSAVSSYSYETGDRKYDVTVKKIGIHPFTVDGLAILHIPSFPDLYCKYCPMELFKDNRGPEAHQLSFGFYF